MHLDRVRRPGILHCCHPDFHSLNIRYYGLETTRMRLRPLLSLDWVVFGRVKATWMLVGIGDVW